MQKPSLYIAKLDGQTTFGNTPSLAVANLQLLYRQNGVTMNGQPEITPVWVNAPHPDLILATPIESKANGKHLHRS